MNIFVTRPLSKFLQKNNIDLWAAVNYVQKVLIKIEDLRNDTKFENLVEQKEKFIQPKQEDYSFTPLVLVRARRI